ncbi:MAG: methionine--tRNA ligase [Planctomycetota bacterium]
MLRPLLVTAALPYANGQPHFGHMCGAYLPFDVFVRYHRLIGSDVTAICGTDDHGVANTLGAEREGIGYREFVDRGYRLWKETFALLEIEFDNFSQTCREDPHYPLAQEFFLRLLENGHVVRRDIQQLYSPATKRFLADRYVVGQCYICGHPDARGDECPKCGTWLDATRLIEPRSRLDPEDKLELRDSWQYELDLAPFADHPLVKPWLTRFRERLKSNVRNFVFTKMIEGEGLESRPITRDLPWGVPVPVADLDGQAIEEVEGKVLYVWLDAPIGYISSTIEWARAHGQDWRRLWIRKRGEEGARLIHFIGKDNITFHCVVFPAMLAWQSLDRDGLLGPGPGEEYVLPENVPANEFFLLEGKKFSKSEGWYLEIAPFVEKYGVDRTRYYLISAMPETADSSFLWREFKARTDYLANVFGNFAVRVLKFVHNYFDNRVPPRTGFDDEAKKVAAAIEARTRAVASHIENYEFRRALQEFTGLAEDGNQFLDATAPWKLRKTDMEACGSALHLALQFLPPLSVLAAPFVPGLAARLRAMLRLPPREAGPLLPAETLPAGHGLGEAEVLVEKISDEEIEAEIAALTR